MTREQFNEIKERLAKWREERRLTYENQQAGFLGNVFEEVSEYFRAKNDYEKVDSICDIAVFCFNAFDFNFKGFKYEHIKGDNIIEDIISDFSISIYDNKIHKFEEWAYKTLCKIECLCNEFGFDFYKCMIETIKEIESRTGYYNITLKKFIKNTGAYSKIEALDLAVNDFKLTNTINKYFLDKEDNDYWYIKIEDNNGDYELYCIKKWYKADYESCRLI